MLAWSFNVVSQNQSFVSRKMIPVSKDVPDLFKPLNFSPNNGLKYSLQKGNEYFRAGDISTLDTMEVIGTTTYDLQTYGSLGNKIYFRNDSVNVVWNASAALTPNFPDKGTVNNFFNGSSWNGSNGAFLDSVLFSNIDMGSNNTEYVVGHNDFSSAPDDLVLLKRFPAGSGPWLKSVLPPHPQGNFCKWAKMRVGGTNGSTIHVIALTQPVADGGATINGMDGAMTYSRSQDGGITWDKVHEFLPGVDQSNYKSMLPETYAIDVNGSAIAIVQGSFFNDWVLWKSLDNGDTWNRQVIWPFPLPAYDVNNHITDIDGDGVADTANFIDGSLAVLIDNNDLVHTWAGSMRSLQLIPGANNFGIFPNTDGLYYWNENFLIGLPVIIASAPDLDTNGVITIATSIGDYHCSLTSMPTAGLDAANNIILAYSSIKENTSNGGIPDQSFRNIYSMISPDGGNSWSLPVNVYDTDFEEVVYPMLARNVGPDLHLAIIVDGEPGTSFFENDAVFISEVRYLAKDENDLFAGVPLVPLPNLMIKGNVYFDQNQNKMKDPGEFGLRNINVRLNPNDFALTDSVGDFLFVKPAGTYTVTISINSNWQLTTDSVSYTFTIGSGTVDSLDFGYYSPAPAFEIETILFGGIPRCNDEIDYLIHYRNAGTNVTSGTVRMIKDPQLGYLSSFPVYTTASADTFEWNFSNLNPFEQRNIYFSVSSTGLFVGDTVANRAEVIFSTSGAPGLDADSLTQAITCSFDPNDKIVKPEGFDAPHYTLKSDTLYYTIRFQNVGNDTAFVVRIRDTLDINIDPASFNVIGSSHPANISRSANAAILFTFNNILLPDSSTNSAGSCGFIRYSAKALPNATPGNVIYNTAHIYFDYNPAVVTNTTFNTLVVPLGISELSQSEINMHAMPNPFSTGFEINFSEELTRPHSLNFTDITGREIRTIQNITGKKIQVDFNDISSGLYFCALMDENGIQIGKQKIFKK